MVKTTVKKITPRQLAIMIARLAHSRHSEDIVILDLREISDVTDYFVIFTGTSDRQMVSVADEIIEEAAKVGHCLFNIAGRETGKWILLDFINVVVHIFDEFHRDYYDLELIWGDAPRVKWQIEQEESQK